MAGLEESIVDIRKKYPAMFELDSAGAGGNAASVFDVGGANAAGGDAYLPTAARDEFTMPIGTGAPAAPAAGGGGGGGLYEYKYPGYAGLGTEGNFAGYEGVSGEGQPQPSNQQIDDRANFILSRSAQVRAGQRGMDAGGGDPRMAQIEQAIAQLRMAPTGGGVSGFTPAAGFSG